MATVSTVNLLKNMNRLSKVIMKSERQKPEPNENVIKAAKEIVRETNIAIENTKEEIEDLTDADKKIKKAVSHVLSMYQ